MSLIHNKEKCMKVKCYVASHEDIAELEEFLFKAQMMSNTETHFCFEVDVNAIEAWKVH